MKQKTVHDIIIIGAGASGLMAAIAAKTSNEACDVLLLEKNTFAAKKIFATGNGKCNFLNRYASPSDYYSRETDTCALDLIASVFSSVPVSKIESVFEEIGIVAAEEENGRLYPRSFQAKSVVDALCQALEDKKIPIVFDSTVKSCHKENHGFTLMTQDGKTYQGRSVVLALGGKAGCQYGSEGDGYKLAESIGHRIAKPIPALTQIISQEDTSNVFGVRAKATLYLWKKKDGFETLVGKDAGEVQFTKEGISGICTFNISRFLELEQGVSYKVIVDAFADYAQEQLEAMLLERHTYLKERPVGHILYGLIPDKLCDDILRRAGMSNIEKVKNIPKVKLQALSKNCKELVFTVLKTKSWKDAQVTAGGVACCELKKGTLESKLAERLFFAGEIVDVDGPCGGFNLTWAFASGYAAGLWAAEKCRC